MYVPTIVTIVLLRYYLVQGINRQNAIAGIAALAAVGALFIVAQFIGTMAVPHEDFVRYLRSRMADPSRDNLLGFSYIWYQPLPKEIADTWARMPSNILGIPVFALLIWLHTPLWRYFARLDQCAVGRDASPHRDRRDRDRQRSLSHHVRDGVRLFAMDFELGGVPVSDPACGEDAAGFRGGAADTGG